MQPRVHIADEQPDIRPALALLLKRESFAAATPTSMSRTRLLTNAFVVGAWLPVATLAQTPPAEGIAEIVVTARKIEENLQDVPMSVQVLSGDFLDEANLTLLYELQFNTPGLLINSSGLWRTHRVLAPPHQGTDHRP